MNSSFGSIRNTSIEEVLNDNEIQKTWVINKDKIEICQDCEYRYCCTDCRAYTDDSENIYSRPSKCNYNPYIGKWKGENDYVEVNQWLKKNKI